MTTVQVLILGLVQGFTEFLPVSSSGHLWIFETLIFHVEHSVPLEAFLHLATLLAVVMYFRQRVWSLVVNFCSPKGEKSEKSLAWKLGVATLMTFPLAYLLKPYVENDLGKEVVAITLCITGILVLISEYFALKKTQDFSWPVAVFLGVVQSIAVIPGISRSGVTIVFLLLVGIEKKKAVELSFLLSIPTIAGGFVYLLPELEAASFALIPLLLSGLVAFMAAIFAIWGMLRWIEKYWKYFALWCFVVAGIIIVT